ncbi:hypothetical protein QWY93_03730 [Echinicola jeungdonensis]|uniref:Glycosyltransferase RgtA/B/C/D-like domain-containing protein n=1 Tax=Echinicola jeungdonensis TaxID=709343 RepID=A0ABV5J1A5_9BACT|nr:hypothetical protein [Echinicola jeungdonensis]MDN3668436.1 hypothetical protein [Echinicola jeungdonensis]
MNPIGQSTHLTLKLFLGLMALISLISFWIYGPYFSPDTTNYFLYAQDMQGQKNLYGSAYSPVYPFLICLSSYFGIGQINWAAGLALIIYGVNILFTIKTAHLLQNKPSSPSQQYLVFIALIFLHAWWSFRMCTWAHADSLFYACLMAWFYHGIKWIKSHLKAPLVVFSLLSAALIWTKLNGIILIPFLGILWVRNYKNGWAWPFISSLIAYLAYQYSYPGNVFSSPFVQENLFSIWSAKLAFTQISEVFKISLGFLFSDFLTTKIPDFIAFPGGILLFGGLIWAIFNAFPRKGIPFFLLFFSSLYLLGLLAFQHLIGFEEINYRTLFPFIWPVFWAFMIWLGKREKHLINGAIIIGFFLFSHTMAGHVLYFNKTHHNSLFEAKSIQESELIAEIKKVQAQFSAPPHLYSDHPEMLSFLLENAPVSHPFPKTYFEAGKTRPLSSSKQKKAGQLFKEQMNNGKALLVLFKPNQKISEEIHMDNFTVRIYPKGNLIFKKK